jgi:uncharacterized integral membrane protein
MLKKSRIVANRTSKMNGTNNMQLDKEDTQRSNLYSKYLTVTVLLCRNILILLFVFIVFNKVTCKVQLDLTLRSPSKRS